MNRSRYASTVDGTKSLGEDREVMIVALFGFDPPLVVLDAIKGLAEKEYRNEGGQEWNGEEQHKHDSPHGGMSSWFDGPFPSHIINLESPR